MSDVLFVPENIDFLTNWEGFELPKGILNKGVTGCGATSVAIEDEHKAIICSPRINLIKNKCSQHKGLMAVYGDVGNKEIADYLEKTDKPKIMVTYDSFPRLSEFIDDKDGWRIVVDEYQYLLIDSGFRSEKTIDLLNALKKFDYVTYLSATPIADKYLQEMDHFKDMPYTVLKWENSEKINVKRVVSAKPINTALEIVRNYQNGIFPKIGEVESRECVIFLNSVTNIVNIIKKANLQPEEVNIIVAKNDDNEKFIKELGVKYEIGSIPLEGELHRMFTFCTSTAFAGCDFYSTCASTFVVSDNKRVHTSIDIATELAQIAGRQRLECNPFRKQIFFIYNVDNGESDSAIYKNEIEERLSSSIETAECKDKSPKKARQHFIRETLETQRLHKYSESYVRYDADSDKFTVNKWAYLNDLFAYDVQHENYENSIIVKGQLDNSGFETTDGEIMSDYKEQVECILVKEGFAERMKRYCEHRQNKENCCFYMGSDIMDRQYPELAIYYDKLGYERIKALGYKENALKNEIEYLHIGTPLINEFQRIFHSGDRLTTDGIKSMMNNVYSDFGIKKKGVVSHLEKEYGIRIKAVKIPLPDGSRKNGWEIL